MKLAIWHHISKRASCNYVTSRPLSNFKIFSLQIYVKTIFLIYYVLFSGNMSQLYTCEECGEKVIEEEIMEDILITGPGFEDVVRVFLCHDCWEKQIDPEAFVEL